MGLYRTGDVNRGCERELGNAGLDDGEVDRDYPCHLDGAAKGDLAVALGKVEVAYGEVGAGDVDGEVDF